MIMKFLIPLSIIAAGIGIYAFLQAVKPEPPTKQDKPRAISVFVEPVRKFNLPPKIFAQGEVKARTEVDVVAQVAGRVTLISEEFVAGGRVRPGESLISIDETDYQYAVLQGEASVAEAKVWVQKAKADADVAKHQLRQVHKPSELALKKPQLDQVLAQLKAATAELEKARTNFSRTRVTMPFNGRVINRNVSIGQYVTPGTVLGRVFGIDKVEIRLAFSDVQLASLGLPIGYVAQTGQGLPVILSARIAGQKHTWHGRLNRLDAAINRATRTLYGLVEVKEPYGAGASILGMPLAIGLFVDAEISGREIQDALVIPRQGLRAGNQVHVVNSLGKLEIRNVKVSYSSDTEAAISRGLMIGDQVVISSLRNPIQGMTLEAMPVQHQSTALNAKKIDSELDKKSTQIIKG
ncbi:MAG TPA: efflux RND transporter periplasmic adaptor subunit [Gammaproteobacteria bacterium]|nr:efflux RND transporter periplasmic adaptor subunit [Gammaproteobacteria bacterium]HIK70377.1 efflux RND transporter periplasmic adaptor subunit [Pseudomonadales bacterium]